MICHSTTKLKNIGWADKKEKFFSEIKQNKGITLIALVITIVLNCCGAAMV